MILECFRWSKLQMEILANCEITADFFETKLTCVIFYTFIVLSMCVC